MIRWGMAQADHEHRWFKIDGVNVCLVCEQEETVVTLEAKEEYL